MIVYNFRILRQFDDQCMNIIFVRCFATVSVIHFSSIRNTLANVRHPLGGVQIMI